MSPRSCTPSPKVLCPEEVSVSETSLESIFFAALECSPSERAAYLDGACGGDAELRACVEKMLAAQIDLGDFLGAPAGTLIMDLPIEARKTPVPLSGATIAGKYRLLEPI